VFIMGQSAPGCKRVLWIDPELPDNGKTPWPNAMAGPGRETMTDPKLPVLISAEKIQARIRELGAQISADFPQGDLYFICILKGACFFMTDLARAMTRDVWVDFMGISTYGKGKSTSGEVRVTKDLDISIEGSNVVIVEDIVDSGVTLNYLMHVLDQRKPRSIRIAALLDKPERRLRPVHVQYAGFQIEDRFVVGYGLDCAEKYRNLDDVCILEEP
jgi:hypoxanthine phosphoribosyltransferase